MITLSVAELMAQFSKVLAAVRAGERIGILYGQSREPIAMIVPYEPPDLPAYSPDLNPIEQAFAKIRRWMCDTQMRTVKTPGRTWRGPDRELQARCTMARGRTSGRRVPVIEPPVL